MIEALIQENKAATTHILAFFDQDGERQPAMGMEILHKTIRQLESVLGTERLSSSDTVLAIEMIKTYRQLIANLLNI